MNQAFIDLLAAARVVVESAGTHPSLSSGDLCVNGKAVELLLNAVKQADKAVPPDAMKRADDAMRKLTQ
jgi:hypothetical protein